MHSFYADVITGSQHFHATAPVSDLAMLEPRTRQLVAQIIDDAEANGVSLIPFETYRSREPQALLFERGATKLRRVGVHHYGLACDLVRSIDGEASWKGDFAIVGQLAHGHGLIWGGDWGAPNARHSFVDVYHVQRCTIARQAALFRGDWYPDESYDPYHDTGTAVLAAVAMVAAGPGALAAPAPAALVAERVPAGRDVTVDDGSPRRRPRKRDRR